MTIVIGWWALPTLLSLVTFVWLLMPVHSPPYYNQEAARGLGAVIVNLLVWIIWLIAR